MSPRQRPGRTPTPPASLGHAMRCGWCRKVSYVSRRAAKKALRRLYPHEVGGGMCAYPCRAGGVGYHIGHRDPRFEHADPPDADTA